MFKELMASNLLLFFPSTLLVLFGMGPFAFIYELVTGLGCRIGILVGRSRKGRFLRSIQTKYY